MHKKSLWSIPKDNPMALISPLYLAPSLKLPSSQGEKSIELGPLPIVEGGLSICKSSSKRVFLLKKEDLAQKESLIPC